MTQIDSNKTLVATSLAAPSLGTPFEENPRRSERPLVMPRRVEVVPVVALVLGCLLTAASYETSWVHLAYRLPRMHAVIDTTIGLVSLLVAYLVYGRFEALHKRRDYVLAFALGLGGLVSLFAATTQGISSASLGRPEVWTAMVGRLLVAILFAIAALTSDDKVERGGSPTRFVGGLTIAFVALMGVAYAASYKLLPWSSDLSVSPRDASKPLFVGPSLLLVAQAAVAVAFAVAGWRFSRRHSESDDLMTWLAASCLLFALASVDYLAFPSIFSDWIYVGDVLLLAGIVLLLVGAAREIGRYRTERIAIEERRRVAHDLHDGVAQELAYIATLARRMERSTDVQDAHRIADAARHALDESRLVIAALAGAGDAGKQLTLTARDAARRFDLDVTLDLPPLIDLAPEKVEAVLRIVREAITNVGRHAHARTIQIRYREGHPAVLELRDDGDGFDPNNHAPGFGLTAMQERAAAIGASLVVEPDWPGGTLVRLELP
jgi:signal transduction histidine kinase